MKPLSPIPQSPLVLDAQEGFGLSYADEDTADTVIPLFPGHIIGSFLTDLEGNFGDIVPAMDDETDTISPSLSPSPVQIHHPPSAPPPPAPRSQKISLSMSQHQSQAHLQSLSRTLSMLSTATTATDLESVASDATSLRSLRLQVPSHHAPPPMIRRASSNSNVSQLRRASVDSEVSTRLTFPPLPPIPAGGSSAGSVPTTPTGSTSQRRVTLSTAEDTRPASSGMSPTMSSASGRRGPAVPLTINVIGPHSKKGVVIKVR